MSRNIRSIEIIGKLSIEFIRNIGYGEIAKIYITCIQLLLYSYFLDKAVIV